MWLVYVHRMPIRCYMKLPNGSASRFCPGAALQIGVTKAESGLAKGGALTTAQNRVKIARKVQMNTPFTDLGECRVQQARAFARRLTSLNGKTSVPTNSSS